jgi:hypothetical protein
LNRPSLNLIALIMAILSAGLMIYLFAASRNDPSLRIAALVAGTNCVASLLSISSTLLTGKDVTQKADPKDPPPGATQVTQTAPATATVTIAPDPTQNNPTKK